MRDLRRCFAKPDTIEHRTGLRLHAGQYDLSPGEPRLFDKLLKRLRAARVEQRHEPQAQDDDARRLSQPAQRVEQFARDPEEEGPGNPEHLDTRRQIVALVEIPGVAFRTAPAPHLDFDGPSARA